MKMTALDYILNQPGRYRMISNCHDKLAKFDISRPQYERFYCTKCEQPCETHTLDIDNQAERIRALVLHLAALNLRAVPDSTMKNFIEAVENM